MPGVLRRDGTAVHRLQPVLGVVGEGLTVHIIPPDSLSPRARKHPLRKLMALMAHIFPRTISRNGSARYGLPTLSTDVPPRAALPVAPMDARKDERIQLG